MDELQQPKNTGNTGQRIALAIVGVLVILGIIAGIYILTGPHNAVEAVMRTSLAGEKANYEANGKISINTNVSGIPLPTTDIPFKMRVVENNYRIDFFESFSDTDNPIYTIYVAYSPDGNIQHYEEGEIADLLNLAMAIFSFVGTINDNALPNLPSMNSSTNALDSAAVADFVSKIQFEKNESGYQVIIYGQNMLALIDSMISNNDLPFENIFEDILKDAKLIMSYDQNGNPQKMTLEGADTTINVDTEFIGTIQGNVNIQIQASFSRLGQVSPQEVALPSAATAK